jgi:GDP-L-fucose synthase
MHDGFLNTPFKLDNKKIWVAGHKGLVGSALCRRLEKENCSILVTGRERLDLLRQADVENYLEENKPDIVIITAARVGGIQANSLYPANFIYENLAIETNIIHAAWKFGVEKLLFLGSSCIYPGEALQPIKEDSLLCGPLEQSNEWYAIAKIAGIKLCQAYRRQYGCDFITAMPCNLYGPGDNFDPENSHVIPALIMKAYQAGKTGQALAVWGSGKPKREFLYVEDMADALLFVLKNYSDERPVNIGAGREITIAELVEKICKTVGYDGPVSFDSGKPDGCMRKLMDSSRITANGWKPHTSLDDGLAATYKWCREKSLLA